MWSMIPISRKYQFKPRSTYLFQKVPIWTRKELIGTRKYPYEQESPLLNQQVPSWTRKYPNEPEINQLNQTVSIRQKIPISIKKYLYEPESTHFNQYLFSSKSIHLNQNDPFDPEITYLNRKVPNWTRKYQF